MKQFAILNSLLSTVFTSLIAQQPTSEQLLIPVKKKYGVFVSVHHDTAIVFKLNSIIDKAGFGYKLNLVDTAVKHSQAADGKYEGHFTTLTKEQDGIFVTVQENKNTKPQKIELQITNDDNKIKEVNNVINNGYWWTSFLEFSKEIQPQLPWYIFSWRYGFRFWELLPNRDIGYKEFKEFADNRLKEFGDSLVSAEFANARNTKHIIDNLANIDYETVRDLVSKLPALTYQQRYLSAVTNQVCVKRPELFFRLADDLPTKKQEMFYAVDRNKETMTKLRAVETDSASKKEFFKKS